MIIYSVDGNSNSLLHTLHSVDFLKVCSSESYTVFFFLVPSDYLVPSKQFIRAENLYFMADVIRIFGFKRNSHSRIIREILFQFSSIYSDYRMDCNLQIGDIKILYY